MHLNYDQLDATNVRASAGKSSPSTGVFPPPLTHTQRRSVYPGDRKIRKFQKIQLQGTNAKRIDFYHIDNKNVNNFCQFQDFLIKHAVLIQLIYSLLNCLH